MKKYMIGFILLFIIICTQASAEITGDCGPNVTWVYDNTTYTLTMSGSG